MCYVTSLVTIIVSRSISDVLFVSVNVIIVTVIINEVMKLS